MNTMNREWTKKLLAAAGCLALSLATGVGCFSCEPDGSRRTAACARIERAIERTLEETAAIASQIEEAGGRHLRSHGLWELARDCANQSAARSARCRTLEPYLLRYQQLQDEWSHLGLEFVAARCAQ